MIQTAPDHRWNLVLKQGGNWLDFLRLLAAIMVIYGHAFPLSRGTGGPPLRIDMFFRERIAGVGLAIFFVISGFLIPASWERRSSWGRFLWARTLRIFPGLIVLVFLTMFILGPLTTNLSLQSYFQNSETFQYFNVLLLAKTNYGLPGVFTDNIYPNAVNGSLWTLFFEVLFYLMILCLGAMRWLGARTALLLFVGCLLTRLALPYAGDLLGIKGSFVYFSMTHGSKLLLYFLAGTALYYLRFSLPLTWSGALLCLGAFFVLRFGFGISFIYWMALFGGYLVFFLATIPIKPFLAWSDLGDFSYGVYIYAFPIQQWLVHLYGGEMSAELNFVLATVLSVLFGAASWHFVEKHALRLKKVRFAWRSRELNV